MKKILDKGNEFVKKEYERLGRILGIQSLFLLDNNNVLHSDDNYFALLQMVTSV